MLLAATLLAFAAATITAWLVVRKRRQYLPIALLLTLGIVGDLLGELIRRSYLDAQPRPYIDQPARALYHLEQALFLAWPAGVVACSMSVLVGPDLNAQKVAVSSRDFARSFNPFGLRLKTERWVVVAWLVALLVHIIGYPTLRQDTLAIALRIEQGIAVAALAWCVVAWSAKKDSEPEHLAALLLAIVEAHVLLFVHTAGLFELWWIAQAVYLAAFFWMTVGQVRWLWMRQRV